MKTVILIGSGHAHLEVLMKLSSAETLKHRFLLVSPQTKTFYSGFIPRFIAGEIDESSLSIASADYARRKGVQFIQASMTSFDAKQKTVSLSNGRTLNFDILSINVGSEPKQIPSRSPFNTIYPKPFDIFVQRWREVQRRFSACASIKFVVIGGGAAAVEIATALRLRLDENHSMKSEIHLVTSGARVCGSYSEKTSNAILHSLVRNKIIVHLNESVAEIGDMQLALSDGKKLAFDEIIVAASVRPGSYKTDDHLRIAPDVFAAGDVVDSDLPKSGVIAVHEGRYLGTMIQHQLNGETSPSFHAPKRQINILISGPRTAHLVWGKWSIEGRLPRLIKNWIDSSYMRKW
ncbi:FAD-dependent oxidoreductase [soil metagenome]